MEHLLLKVLRFDVAVPTANVFCDRFLKETKTDEKTASLAMVRILSVKPSPEALLHIPFCCS